MSNKTRTQLTLVGAVMFLSVSFVPAGAQTRQQPKIQPPAQAGGGEPTNAPPILVSPDEDYRIGARDVIEIRVDDAPELSVTTSVNADGTFLMPYLKRVKAISKTPEELSREIADRLRGRYLKDPNVIVLVKQFYSRSFFILGAVKKPGVYQIEGRPQLLRLITLAGGPAESHGSVAFIIREIKKKETTSPSDPATTKPTPNSDQTTTNESIDAASADEPEYDIKMVNINGMFKGLGLGGKDSYLEPGDIVNIPQADIFYVAGEVNAPGSFPLSEGTTLRQAIALSQGTTMNAALGSGVIFRQDASTGKRLEIPVNIGAVMKAKKEDIPLLANDIVIVPNSRTKTIGNSILKAVGMGAAQRGVIY
jgi:polysaccharide biosynthesis/export protein